MKLLTAIINNNDSNKVGDNLRKAGFYFTKIATIGGFLEKGNITMLIGVEDEKVDEVIEIIRQNSASRMESVPNLDFRPGQEFLLGIPDEVRVGGATVFVTNVERFEKM